MNVSVVEAAQTTRKINIGRNVELVARKQKRMERRTKARNVMEKANEKLKVKEHIKIKVRRQRKSTPKLVWTRCEQQQLETATVYSKGIVWLWTVGPTCGSNTRKTNQ